MRVHPIRAYLKSTRFGVYVRSRPILHRTAWAIWSVTARIYHGTMAIVRMPLIILYGPILGVISLLALLPSKRTTAANTISNQPLEIVMLVISEVFRDPRVEREARTLADAGFKVKILYPDYLGVHYNVGRIDWGPGIEFKPLPHWFAAYIDRFPYVLGFQFLGAAIRERPFAFHAHDLSTAMVGLAAARFTNAYCVCDFHEWYSENVTWDQPTKAYVAHPRHVRAIYKFVERLVLRRAAAIVTVCDSIAEELHNMSGGLRDVIVVRNVPPIRIFAQFANSGSLREALSLRADQFLLLYQGGTGPTRLLEPVIKAMAKAPRAVLAIRGPGIEYFGPDYEKLARSLGVADRVFCLPPVPSHEVVEAAAGADAGIWTLPNLCKNFSFALPNKLFEYLSAGLPVLVADYPEAAKLVNRYEVGLTFDPYSCRSIAACINELIERPEVRNRMARNTRAALEDIQPDKEWQKLVTLYRELASGHEPEKCPDLAPHDVAPSN